MPDLKTSPEQRILSLIGISKQDGTAVKGIQQNCLRYFATNEKILGPRELRSQNTEHVIEVNGILKLKSDLESDLIKAKSDYIKDSPVIKIIS